MTTRAAARPKHRAWWDNPPGIVRVTVRRRGREQVLGPHGVLTLAEAADLLGRPVHEVRQAIRTGFLRTRRRGPQLVVTPAACRQFLNEERADGEAAVAALEEMRRTGAKPIPAEQVHRELGLE